MGNGVSVAQAVGLGAEVVRPAISKWLSSGSREHHLVVGEPEVGDILLYIDQKSKGHGVDDSHVFQYSEDVTITAVVARDNWNDDTGGYPEIISGGPGHKHVEVKVTSGSRGGFDHTFQVYGKKQKSKKCILM